MSRRQHWLAAVRGPDFPSKLRPIRATMLCLPMTVDGRVIEDDDRIAAATGLPRRTLQWHLKKAVDTGWLVRQSRGGNGVRHRFTAAVPPGGVRNTLRTGGVRSAQLTMHSGGSGVRNVVAHINKDSANASEHVAVDNHRERRTEHGGTRAEADRDELQLRSDERATIRVRLADLSPWARLSYAPLTGRAAAA